MFTFFSTLTAKFSTISGLNMGTFLDYNGLIGAAVLPWMSVANPLVTILFVERYRKFMRKLILGNPHQIGVGANIQMVPVDGHRGGGDPLTRTNTQIPIDTLRLARDT